MGKKGFIDLRGGQVPAELGARSGCCMGQYNRPSYPWFHAGESWCRCRHGNVPCRWLPQGWVPSTCLAPAGVAPAHLLSGLLHPMHPLLLAVLVPLISLAMPTCPSFRCLAGLRGIILLYSPEQPF